MKYALLIYRDETFFASEEGRQAMPGFVAKFQAFSQELGDRQITNVRLKGSDMATTVRDAGGGRTIHDGPFAETKEQLGGLYVIDVADLDAAIDVAKSLPVPPGGAVEVRPMMEMG
jgi:hypothetical protein